MSPSVRLGVGLYNVGRWAAGSQGQVAELSTDLHREFAKLKVG